MSLKYPGEWKFEGIGFSIPIEAVREFQDLIVQIADGSQDIIERFKAAFGVDMYSTSYDWAVTDLYEKALTSKSDNAAVFVDTLWKGIETVKSQGVPVPSNNKINQILAKHNIPLKIMPPDLIRVADTAIVDAATATDNKTSYRVYPHVRFGR